MSYITAAIVGLLLCIINPIVGFLVAWWMIDTHEDNARRDAQLKREVEKSVRQDREREMLYLRREQRRA